MTARKKQREARVQVPDYINRLVREELIRRARERFCNISPCGRRQRLDNCFTRYGDRLFFWFNDERCSTHLETISFSEVSSLQAVPGGDSGELVRAS